MRFSTISVLTVGYLAATALANPFALESRRDKMCAKNNMGTAQCCSMNEYGVANLDCEDPKKNPHNMKKFKKYCAKKGKEPVCCMPAVNGDGPVCHGP